MLGTLVARGLVRRDPERRVYCLGFRCFEYARQAYAMPDLVSAASPELRTLRDLTGETSYLAVLDGNEVLSLERCDGAHGHRSAAAVGERKPLHCTSQGKAILSAMDAPAREALVKELTLRAHAAHDHRPAAAQRELKLTRTRLCDRRRGIALGVRAGAPIVDARARCAGRSAFGPGVSAHDTSVELLGPEVALAARRIGQQMPSAGRSLMVHPH
jgi:DNA-binding IclR family transcriptional regulator